MAGKKGEANTGQAMLGGDDIGFSRSLRETDQGYLSAVEGFTAIDGMIKKLSAERDDVLKEKMAEITPYRLSINRRIGMLTRLGDAMKFGKAMEEARIMSMEGTGTVYVFATVPKGVLRDWIYVKWENDYEDAIAGRDEDEHMLLATFGAGYRREYFVESLVDELGANPDFDTE